MIGYAIDVDTRELTRVLKRLLRMDKREPVVYLRYVPEKLTISLGQTSEELAVTGGPWPSLVSADAKWVNAPRGYGVDCTVYNEEEVAARVGRKAKRAVQ